LLKVFAGARFSKSAKERQVTVTKIFRRNLLDRETLASGTVSNRVQISELEAALLQVLAVIEHRAADKKRAVRVDNQANV
jgi:hypothetical protein